MSTYNIEELVHTYKKEARQTRCTEGHRFVTGKATLVIGYHAYPVLAIELVCGKGETTSSYNVAL